jgi:hypothetical protein
MVSGHMLAAASSKIRAILLAGYFCINSDYFPQLT